MHIINITLLLLILLLITTNLSIHITVKLRDDSRIEISAVKESIGNTEKR